MSKVPLTRIDPAGATNGDLIQRQSGIWVPRSIGEIIPGGSVGEVLTKQSSTDGDWDWEAGGGGGALVPDKTPFAGPDGLCLVEDFISDTELEGLARSTASATNIGMSGLNSNTHPGVVYLTTASSSAVTVSLLSGNLSGTNAAFVTGGGRMRCGWLIRTPSALSDASNNYYVYLGFIKIALSSVGAGLIFYYNHSENGGRWYCNNRQVTAGANDNSYADSGITFAVDTWYFMEIEVNAAGTSVEYFIDGASVGTVTGDIPPTSDWLGWGCAIQKFAGSTARAIAVDYAYVEKEIDTPRFAYA